MEGFIGEIRMFGGNFAPRGWALCEGQLLEIQSHSALFSILGITYGGDGRTTFALPDLRGRFPVQPGKAPGLQDHRLGQKSGKNVAQLTVQNLPAHNHRVRVADQVINSNVPDDILLGDFGDANAYRKAPFAPDKQNFAHESFVADTGDGEPFSVENPSLGINFILCLVGEFPARA